jgi:uncharacterized paraquat-inducible protein A
MIRILNLSLLVLFPIAWSAPLLRAGVLPFFNLNKISLLSGLITLWSKEPPFAVLLTFLVILAPLAKIIALEAVLTKRLSARFKPWLFHLGRLAMADVFLIAIYITVTKGIGVGRIEAAWGLYLFTACVLLSLSLSLLTSRR